LTSHFCKYIWILTSWWSKLVMVSCILEIIIILMVLSTFGFADSCLFWLHHRCNILSTNYVYQTLCLPTILLCKCYYLLLHIKILSSIYNLTIMFGNVFKLFRRKFKLIFYQLNRLSLCEVIVLSSHAHSIYYNIFCVEGRTMVITLLYAWRGTKYKNKQDNYR